MARRLMLFGTFDGCHPGHRFFLRQAAARAHELGIPPAECIVIIARDATVVRRKGAPPAHAEDARAAAVRQCLPQATVLLGHPTDMLHFVRDLTPDFLILGYDQTLPPGVASSDLPRHVERLPAYEPQKWKSSLLLRNQPGNAASETQANDREAQAMRDADASGDHASQTSCGRHTLST